MALLPQLLSAIMGSGANKNFDPNDPTSMPFEEAKSGFGRFARRLGTGVDAAGINNEYAAKRSAEDRGQNFRSQLLDKEQDFRSGMFDKEQTATAARDAARAKEEWNQLHSRLTNQAAMQNAQTAFQSKLFNAREAGDRQQQQVREAQDLFEQTGTWDPIQQAEILSQIRTQRANEPRALGSGTFFDPRTGKVHSRVPSTDPAWDFNSNTMTPGRPESWRSWDPMSASAEESAPSTGASASPAAGGRSLGNPEEIRAALGIRDSSTPATPAEQSPKSSLLDRARMWIDGQLPGGKTNLSTLPDRAKIISRLFKQHGVSEQNLEN